MHWPDNYPFPESLHGRGRDFKYGISTFLLHTPFLTHRPQSVLVHSYGSGRVRDTRERGESTPWTVSCAPLIIARQFYCEQHTSIGENYARFAFCKDLDTLKHAAERLQNLKQYLR